MPQFLSPIANDQFVDANGDPLTGGQIETYLASSSTPAATYTSSSGGVAHANPLILNSLGYAPSPIWLTGGSTYKFVIKSASGVTLRTIDNISGINDASVSQSEWVESGLVPTYISATSFSVPGDQTPTLQIGRRLRTTNTSGLVYSTISNSVFAAGITTVTLTNDSTTLDAGLTLVAYALLAASPVSVPNLPFTKITGIASLTQGGTGANYASNAALFTGIKQAATTAATGVVELANDAEAQAASDLTRALVPANLAAVLLGVGQTRIDVLASRALGTVYTNTTGRLIEVTVTAGVTGGGSFTLELGPTTVTQTVSASENRVHFFTVKPSETYRISVSAGSLISWYELR